MGVPLVGLVLFPLVVHCLAADADRGSFSILHSLILRGAGESEISNKTSVPIRVIGAGLGRTGTTSLQAGLRQLGYTPYHMKEGVMDMGHESQWARLADAFVDCDVENQRLAKSAVIDLIASEGFDATTDFPACLIFEELMDRYPEAKVILSTRSSGKTWARSVLDTIGRFHLVVSQRPFSFFTRSSVLLKVARGVWLMTPGVELDPATQALDEASLIKAYDDWDKHVRSVVPASRLLVHAASDGFAPICEFLSVSECPLEYPRLNEAAVMKVGLVVLEVVTWIWLPGAVGMAFLIGYCIRCCFCAGKVAGKDD